jgi:hypothetical protein
MTVPDGRNCEASIDLAGSVDRDEGRNKRYGRLTWERGIFLDRA